MTGFLEELNCYQMFSPWKRFVIARSDSDKATPFEEIASLPSVARNDDETLLKAELLRIFL